MIWLDWSHELSTDHGMTVHLTGTHFTEADGISWLRDRSGTNWPIRLVNKRSAGTISSQNT